MLCYVLPECCDAVLAASTRRAGSSADEAMIWARHINNKGRVALLVEGDDDTRLTKQQIATALKSPDDAGDANQSKAA
jgi:hypothetical protein